MEHSDHVGLLLGGMPVGVQGGPPSAWADLGSGTGAFTLALAELLGPGGMIYSVDKDRDALREQERVLRVRYPHIVARYIGADFAGLLHLPPLDGVVMANSLHFQRDKAPVLQLVHGYLKPSGRLIVVEYNVDRGNPWVPYPFSYATWQNMVAQTGFVDTHLLATHPSRFLTEIYSAVSFRPADESAR
jgi:ubiquinone/menaquinone biosynthesis C-methylase UbiE